MSLLNYLQFQKIDDTTDEAVDDYSPSDDISLNEPIDEGSLEKFWDQVVSDVREDPTWFDFAGK